MAVEGLSGLTALAGIQTTTEIQATPEQRYGGTADPRHGKTGEQARPYPWESNTTQAGSHGPYGPENQLLDNPDDWLFFPAGHVSDDPTFDRTPTRGAAPWPKGILSGPIDGHSPDAVAEMRIQSEDIHGTNMGAGLKALTALTPVQDEWTQLHDVSPGHSDQVAIPRQLMSSSFGWATTDRVQSMARQNEFGFDSAHKMRRYATGPIPGNTMWMRPGGRPIRKTLAGPARPAIGPDSPFAGQDLGMAFNPDGAVLQNVPTEYAPPAQPTLASARDAVAVNDSYVEWY